MNRVIALASCVALLSACGNSSPAKSAGSGGNSSGGSDNSGGSGNMTGNNPVGGSVAMHKPAMGDPGVWENVTPAEADPMLFTGQSGFGMGNIVSDPAHPGDMYVGGYGSIWKSTDYGLTWSKLDSNPNPPYLPLGHVLAVAGTQPATLFMANVNGDQKVFKSTDAGLTFTLTGTVAEGAADSFYSMVVDPGDPKHLITGLHEKDGILESTDGADTWKYVSGTGFPTGGKSWFPWFVDTGDAAGTSKTWFAIAQDGGSACMTSDGGKTWKVPTGIDGLQHPHGSTNLLQLGKMLFVAGVQGPGDGVYRSTDLGDNWMKVAEKSANAVWGSDKQLYAMWGWACASCGRNEGGPQYQTAPAPGDTWTMSETPEALNWGPNSVATASDGERSIYVGSMWATGLWRYVEP